MREFLFGVLTAGLTYGVIWYQIIPGAEVVQVKPAPRHIASARGREVLAPTPSVSEPGPTSRSSQAKTPLEADGARPEGQQQRWSQPEARASQAIIEPLPTALPKTIERMAELQRISADPNVLATRVQAMETDEADLAELKAFAERFVELPPDRVERHVPGTSRSGSTHPAGPAARRR